MPGMLQPTREIVWDETGTLARVRVLSLFSSNWNERQLNMTKAQYDLWQRGAYIQAALPHLTPDEREFLLTGATQAEWDHAFPTDD